MYLQELVTEINKVEDKDIVKVTKLNYFSQNVLSIIKLSFVKFLFNI